MAVKHYSTETTNNRPENKYNIAKIIEYIEGIDQDIDVQTNLPHVCECIINLLGHVDIPTNADSISALQESIQKVEQFLEKLSTKCPQEFMVICLRQLYHIIMTTEQPSPAAGIILHRCDEQNIPKATQWVFEHSDPADEDLKRGVQTLVRWVGFPHIVKNLQFWIIEILTVLREQQKYELLYAIAEANIKRLQSFSSIPALHKDVINIVMHILTSLQHTPVIFHGFLKSYTTGYRNSLKSKVDLRQLDDTLVALMMHFPPKNQDIQNEYNRIKDMVQPSTDYNSDILDVPPWHNQSECVRRNTNARVGLVNLGNTCYMNSILQALMMTKQFTRDLLLTEIRTPLFQSMQRLMALLLHSERPQLSPNLVFQTSRPPGFSPGNEQDSSEFLGYLLDQLHEQEQPKCQPQLQVDLYEHKKPAELADESCPMDIDEDVLLSDIEKLEYESNGACAVITDSGAIVTPNETSETICRTTPKTLIQKSFGGIISITYKCLDCQTESKQFDSFRDLHLSFPDADETNAYHSVQELLDFYCSTEKLDAENKYFCEHCKALCVGERFIHLINAPCNLILTLKHFKYDQKFEMRAKLMHKIRHEDLISVKVYPSTDFKDDVILHYRLYAAVVHSGFSMETGHYFTYGSDSSGCYKFDDSYVSKANITELHNLQPPQTPYILFYQMVPNPNESKLQSNTTTHDASSGASSSTTITTTSTVIENDLTKFTMCEYPALEELPPQLREYVNRDNITYIEESRSSRSVTGSVWSRNRKNNLYRSDDDNNDEPPSSCGNSFAPSYNRYIS